MMRLFLVFLVSLLLSNGESSEGDSCCYKRIVSGTRDGLDGEYIFVRSGEDDPVCSKDCVYKR